MTHHYQEGVPRLPGSAQGEFLRAFQRDVMPGVRRGLAATVPAPPLVERLAVALWDEDEQEFKKMAANRSSRPFRAVPWEKANEYDHEQYRATAKRILERVLRG
jgi:hypothetical protein